MSDDNDVPGRLHSGLRPIRTAVTGPGNLLDNLVLTPLGGRASCADVPWDDLTVDGKKNLCHGCPVRTNCLEDALANFEKHDVWGGLDPDERHKLHRSRSWKARRDAAHHLKETPA